MTFEYLKSKEQKELLRWNKKHSRKYILWTCQQIKKRFTVLNKDEILTKEVKKFSFLYDKTICSYQQRDVVRNASVEVAEKLEFLEDSCWFIICC